MLSRDERETWEHFALVASRQYGLLTSAQVSTHFTRTQAQRRAGRGLIIQCGPGVWRLPSTPVTWHQHVLLCCLAGGGLTAASHSCAGALWGLDGLAVGAIHVTSPRRRSLNWARHLDTGLYPVITHSCDIGPTDVVIRDGIPRTGVARTIVDLASGLAPQQLAAVTDDALRNRLVTIDELRTARAVRRTHGVTRLDRIIARRSESGVGESKWEDLLFDWIVAAGLPAPVRQLTVSLPGRSARLDLSYPQYKIAIEFDGFAWHGTRSQFDRDRVRLTKLATAGWLVVGITSAQGRVAAVEAVRQALYARGWIADAV